MKKSAGRLTVDALFTAAALTIFVVELQIPSVGIPGVKQGLANIVTVTAAFLLGSMFSGQVMALWYSLAGGTLCWLTMLPLRKILTEKQIWVMSVIGAVAHNIGQILTALAVTRTAAILYYLPLLMVSGILAGLFTGAAAQLAVLRLRPVLKKRFLR